MNHDTLKQQRVLATLGLKCASEIPQFGAPRILNTPLGTKKNWDVLPLDTNAKQSNSGKEHNGIGP